MKMLLRIILVTALGATIGSLAGCENEDPLPENIPELITKATLNFTPVDGGSVIKASATDPDGNGVQDIIVDGPINLKQGVQYELTLELINGLFNPRAEGYDQSEEIEAEADEHQFFFRFSEGVFSSPSGSGNIKDNESSTVGEINYSDADKNGRPLGLSTLWTTANGVATSKFFRVVLKHQPEIKSDNSTSLDGESDLDITFVLNIN